MPSRDKLLSEFGRNVSRFRDQAGLSQDKLAEKADLDRTYLRGIERVVRNPSIKTVLRIAKALGIKTTEFILEDQNIESARVCKFHAVSQPA